jgi:DNA-binding HxlR family transcriptional regulator
MSRDGDPTDMQRSSGWMASEVRGTLTLISRRWVLDVLNELQRGSTRRNTLRRRLSPVSDRVLTAVLRDLERAGLVSRTITIGVPVRVDYDLTEHGTSLIHQLNEFAAWCGRANL